MCVFRDLQLGKRKEVITVASENPFNKAYCFDCGRGKTIAYAMDIKDSQGRVHTLTRSSFSDSEWENIKEGSRLEISIGEEIKSVRLAVGMD